MSHPLCFTLPLLKRYFLPHLQQNLEHTLCLIVLFFVASGNTRKIFLILSSHYHLVLVFFLHRVLGTTRPQAESFVSTPRLDRIACRSMRAPHAELDLYVRSILLPSTWTDIFKWSTDSCVLVSMVSRKTPVLQLLVEDGYAFQHQRHRHRRDVDDDDHHSTSSS